ncbi:hypothetical protein NV63_18495 [Elizabethkingia anophelis]|nr:hypothetical protein NV63_18495 [Elizabethkingia anophelis]
MDGELDGEKFAQANITDEMKRIRELDLEDRKKYYLKERIVDQIKWYTGKAKINTNKYLLCFIGIILCQFLAFGSIVYLINHPASNYNLVGLFSALSASGFTWIQLKKYQENKEAYNTAAFELVAIRDNASRSFSEEEFSKYVLDSENAMSREHTLWLAQKRV